MKRNNPKLEYAYLLDEFGFANFEECSEEDNKKYAEMLKNGEELPDGIAPIIDEYGNHYNTFHCYNSDTLTDVDKHLYLQMKKVKLLKTIKNCAVFFVVLEIIAIIIGFIVGLVYNISII